MTLPQQALALTSLEKPLPEGYQRLYFGAEFCSWAFPPLEQIRRAAELAHQSGWGFTLMTPVLREDSLAELERLLGALAADFETGDEILISDFGTLELAHTLLPGFPVVLGRALSGQKRGPRILDLDLTDEALEYFRQGSWYSSGAVQLLQENQIQRVELDNLLQGVAPLPEPLLGSLHYPYAMVTSSRNCPFHRDLSAKRCSLGCGQVFTLTTPQSSVPLLQAGNSQFLQQDELPEQPADLRIDRIVFHAQLPR